MMFGSLRYRAFVLGALVVACLLVAGCGIEVPVLKGMTLDQAEKTLVSAGLTLGSVEYAPESQAATWTVIVQSNSERVDEGTAVAVTLAGPPPTTVPDVRGVSVESATKMIRDADLLVGEPTRSYDEDVAADAVVSQSVAPGTVLPAGAQVELVVSLGPEPPPSDTLRLERFKTMTGPYSPKSVVASQNGYVFANNMIYRHTVTVFDDETYDVVATLKDEVSLPAFGFTEYSGTVKGGPVEAAVTPDGTYMYVSNYSMYGPGFSHPGDDVGGPSSGVDPSFVYRIPVDTLKIDQVIKVGSVPKFVATTPDGRYLLVSNWISYSVSVVDIATGKEVKQIPVGRYPRGIAVSPDSKIAYIAVMGSRDIAKIDLATLEAGYLRGVGSSPRHLVMSPDGRYLYATLNGDGMVAKIDTTTGKVTDRVATGSQPRSMTIASDGKSLYVVNYESNTVSKVRTRDMKELQEVQVGRHPIGIAYVNATGEVWVSCYSGSIIVLRETP